MMTPPPPFPIPPGFAPMPPRPCPPPPPRHPDLWGDADGYTRKEIDDADARTLASAKGYADGTKVGKADLFDNPDTAPKVKSALLPSYVDDVLEFASLSVFPTTGETGKIYVALDTNKTYRWGGTQYVQVGGDEQAQADWAQTNSSSPDFIKNKPTIPAAQVQANWNETDTSSKAFIQNKPTIPTVPTNVSAFTNDAGYLTQHQSLSAYRTATAQDAIDGAQDTAIAAKYTKPATGIPASDLAAGVIPTVPTLPLSIANGGTGATNKNTALANLGAVKKSGDTMTGPLQVNINGVGVEMTQQGVAVYAGLGVAPTIYGDGRITLNNGNRVALPTTAGTFALQEGIAPAFSSSSTYAVGAYVTYEGLLYKCTTAIATAGAWNAANWTAVAVTDEMGADTPLPFDAECEYVASPADGGCGISPPYYFYISGSCDCTIELYIPAGSNSSDCFSIGAWKNSNCCCLFANSGTATQFRYGSTNVVNGTYATDTWQTLGFVGTTVYCGSSTGSFTRSSFSDTTADFGVGFGKNIRIRRIRLTYGGTDIFDARPVRVGQIGAMYDVVSGGIFYSPSTNNLVPGPDKGQPTITTPGRIVELTDSPAFTGTPTAPTAAAGTNTTQVATTEFVQSAIAALRSELGLT